MCGIAGFSLNPDEAINSKRLGRALLLGIEHRGRDATGFAFRDKTGDIQIHKQPLAASDFIKRNLCLPKHTRTAIMHTRFATQGMPENNLNNHPILSGPIVGVHNGHINNDDAIFRDVGVDKRRGFVDSEAIFALMAFGDGPKYTDALEEIQGPAAVAWMNWLDPMNTLHLARAATNPLVVAQTEGGSIIFASTKEAVVAGMDAVGLVPVSIRYPDEGSYLTVHDGSVLDLQTFKPKRAATYYRGARGGWNSWDDDYEFETWKGQNQRALNAATVRAGSTIDDSTKQLSLVAPLEQEAAAIASPSALPVFDPMVSMRTTFNEYCVEYAERETAVNKYWLELGKDDAEQDAVARRKACDWAIYGLHAMTRPGDHVRTYVADTEYEAEVVAAPKSFPEGKYVLRVKVPISDTLVNGPYEYVVVEREAYEFTYIYDPANRRTHTTLTTTEQLMSDASVEGVLEVVTNA